MGTAIGRRRTTATHGGQGWVGVAQLTCASIFVPVARAVTYISSSSHVHWDGRVHEYDSSGWNQAVMAHVKWRRANFLRGERSTGRARRAVLRRMLFCRGSHRDVSLFFFFFSFTFSLLPAVSSRRRTTAISRRFIATLRFARRPSVAPCDSVLGRLPCPLHWQPRCARMYHHPPSDYACRLAVGN